MIEHDHFDDFVDVFSEYKHNTEPDFNLSPDQKQE